MIKQVGLRIEQELASWITNEAKKENRSFNNFIATLLNQEKEKRINDEKKKEKSVEIKNEN